MRTVIAAFDPLVNQAEVHLAADDATVVRGVGHLDAVHENVKVLRLLLREMVQGVGKLLLLGRVKWAQSLLERLTVFLLLCKQYLPEADADFLISVVLGLQPAALAVAWHFEDRAALASADERVNAHDVLPETLWEHRWLVWVEVFGY